jgi:multidrug efflux pump
VIRAAIPYPYIVLVGALIVLVLGAVSYRDLPADLLPTFKTPAVQIVAFYPGMPPEVMEREGIGNSKALSAPRPTRHNI